MEIIRYPKQTDWDSIMQRPLFDTSKVDHVVNEILQNIKQHGDSAVNKYTKKFDNADIQTLSVSRKAIDEAGCKLEPGLKKAIDEASSNITTFHKAQQQPIQKIETSPGVQCWQKSVAIENVGFYIPGGTAPLFSTVLMLGIPGKIAGCREMILCTPPDEEGNIHPAILYAAQLVGITGVYKTGGAQAIGAMAYGTETIPKVHKIFGPGNQYVTAAKQIVSRNAAAIDMPAGPSEVVVMADESANPAFIAADLLSQAEHGNDSQVILVTTKEEIINAVQEEVALQLEQLSRKEYAKEALQHSKAILVNNEEEMTGLINAYAPEHLIISLENYERAAENIINAGSVFLGNYTPESVGDYSSGTNHTLPTNGFAKSYNGVNLDSFVKKITFQELSREGIEQIGNITLEMANAEGLTAHANAVAIRMNQAYEHP
jgi:histidinol dehydrogenase